MKYEALAILLLTACISEEPEAVSTTYQGIRTDDCPKGVCGNNSPELTNGFFHELNLDGHPNDEGYSIVSLIKDGSRYKMNVVNGKITATITFGMVGAPTFLSGDLLEDAYIRLKRVVGGVTTYRRITIASVARSTDFWAHPMDGDDTPKIETYQFLYGNDDSPPPNTPQYSAYVCVDGAFLASDSPVSPMPWRHALVFEGDRIDVPRLHVGTPDSRWFNIGCAETALAKMHLNGMTHASRAAGFTSTPEMRQTFLKMITADYCDRGVDYLFTVPGQHLHWKDTMGTMLLPSTGHRRLEARWDRFGATCLNIPRLEENPPDEEDRPFPNLAAAIDMACGGATPPLCFNNTDSYYLQSYNPI